MVMKLYCSLGTSSSQQLNLLGSSVPFGSQV